MKAWKCYNFLPSEDFIRKMFLNDVAGSLVRSLNLGLLVPPHPPLPTTEEE